MQVKYFIRTTKDRELHHSIKEELGDEFTLLVDNEHKPVDSFIKQLKDISNYDSVLLEDDIILCKGFKQKIESAIKEYKENIINFFSYPSKFFTTYLAIGNFAYNQCTYYPKGVGEIIANEMEKIRQPYNQYDTLENQALWSLEIPHVKYRPCLVQHIDYSTLIQKSHPEPRRCIWFVDYLDELEIEYNKSYTKENKEKLKALMKQKFNETKQ